MPATEPTPVHMYCTTCPVVWTSTSPEDLSFTVMDCVLPLDIANLKPSVMVVASGSSTVWGSSPVKTTNVGLALVSEVVPDAVGIDVRPSVPWFAQRLESPSLTTT